MSATNQIVVWVLSAMTAWSPIGRSYIKNTNETQAAGETRYQEIAEAMTKVAYDAATPPIFQGKNGRARSLLVIASVAFSESSFRWDVDKGEGSLSRGDNGNSHCLMQLNLGTNRKDTSVLLQRIDKAWSADDLIKDRVKCFTAGYVVIKQSFGMCRNSPVEHRLAIYNHKDCEEGAEDSTERMTRAQRWFSLHPPPVVDSDVLAENIPPA